MAKGWNRIETWLTLGVAGIGLLIMAIFGLFVYTSATAPTFYANASDVPTAAGVPPPPAYADAVRQARDRIRAGLAEHNWPGLSVAVGIGNDIVWSEGFGLADLERKVAATPDTLFRIGTASKMLTSAAVGLLLEDGRLKLDDEIQTYVPEFPKKQWPVTLRQLMGHVAGVIPDEGDEEPVTMHCEDAVEGLRRFAQRPLMFEPGTQYRYSNYGWILVSAAVDAAAGERYSTFMRKRIFDPLAMKNTRIDTGAEFRPDVAVYYFPRFAADPRYGPQAPEPVDLSCFAGAEAFLSTAPDLVRLVMAINNGRLLQPATVDLLQTSQQVSPGQATGYGLGWDLETVTVSGQPTPVIGYDGSVRGGIVMTLMTLPTRGLVIAVLSNTSFAATPELTLQLAEIFTTLKS